MLKISNSINIDTPIVKNIKIESSSSDSESYGTDYDDEEEDEKQIITDLVDEIVKKAVNSIHD